VILKMVANRDAIAADVEKMIVEFADRGLRSLGVARTLPGRPADEWYMMGILSLFDPPRPDSKEVIERALTQGVVVKVCSARRGR
jgi:H+-transporting ATPase